MTEPVQIIRSRGLSATLLASARAERAPTGMSRRLLASASVTAALATSSSTASALTALARWVAWKWLAVSVVGGASFAVVSTLVVPPASSSSAPAADARNTQGIQAGGKGPIRRLDAPRAALSTAATPASSAAAPESLATAPSATMQVTNDRAPVRVAWERLVAVAPSASATGATKVPTSHLAGEISALDDAKKALAAGAPSSTLQKLDAYDLAFPGGTLAVEARALRIEALARSGRLDDARDAFVRFKADNPEHPLLEGLARAVGQ
jgi:hypothetical protein